MASLRLMTEAVHAHGALAGVELWHGGARPTPREPRLPTLAPSQIANEHLPWNVPQAMTAADIRREQDAWVAAARRAVEAGFDIVYVYGSHSYLPTQFLSSRTNRRTDAYGGSIENRARFWLEAIERVREAVGDRCAIAVRVAADSFAATGIEPRRAPRSCARADPLVDLWDAAIGADAGEHRTDSGASRSSAQGYQLELTRWMRGATAKPMVGVGRLHRSRPDGRARVERRDRRDRRRPPVDRRPVPARQDPRRPLRRDPRVHRLQPVLLARQLRAATSAARRTRRPARSTGAAGIPSGSSRRRTPRRTCSWSAPARPGWSARSCSAKRGFKRVHLVDAAPEIGGHLRWLPQLPGLGDWARVLDWRRIQLRKLRRSSR